MDLNNAYVRVIRGETKAGALIEDSVFRLLGHVQREPRLGLYITVESDGRADMRQGKNRVYLKNVTDFELLGAQGAAAAAAQAEPERTDDEIAQDLKETFEILAEMTGAVAKGVIRGLVVSGPAGVGKSHTVESELMVTLGMQAKLLGEMPKFEVFKGHTSPVNLYCLLYRYSAPGSVLVLDDADGLLYDEECLNLLKAVLDTKRVRRVNWGANSPVLEKEGVPSAFNFEGGIIFLTNIDWSNAKSARIGNHLQALLSRVHYVQLEINTLRERIIHIRNVALNTDMLDAYNMGKRGKQQVLDWLVEHVNRLHTVDLRTVIKACDLALALPNTWQSRAAKTLFRKAGR